MLDVSGEFGGAAQLNNQQSSLIQEEDLLQNLSGQQIPDFEHLASSSSAAKRVTLIEEEQAIIDD